MAKRRDPEAEITAEDYEKYGPDPVRGIALEALKKEVANMKEAARKRELRAASRAIRQRSASHNKLH